MIEFSTSLSPREIEVLSLLAQGCRCVDVAALLCISPHTVKKHIASIHEKLGAINTVQAVAVATIDGSLFVNTTFRPCTTSG